jgi:hypothetical protein
MLLDFDLGGTDGRDHSPGHGDTSPNHERWFRSGGMSGDGSLEGKHGDMGELLGSLRLGSRGRRAAGCRPRHGACTGVVRYHSTRARVGARWPPEARLARFKGQDASPRAPGRDPRRALGLGACFRSTDAVRRWPALSIRKSEPAGPTAAASRKTTSARTTDSSCGSRR